MVTAVSFHKLGNEVRTLFFGQPALGIYLQPKASIRKTAVPPRVVAGIVKLVVHIPPKHTVAKPTLLGEQTGKLAEPDIFTANHAVDVREA